MARSQPAFIHAVYGRAVMLREPPALNTSANAVANSGSRS